MPDTDFDRQRSALQQLLNLVKTRAAEENRIAATYAAAADDAEKEVQKYRRQIATARHKAKHELDEAYQQQTVDLSTKYSAKHELIEQRKAELIEASQAKFQSNDTKTRASYQDRQWTIDSLVEAAEKEANDHCQKLVRQADGGKKKLAEVWTAVVPHLERVSLTKTDVEFALDRLPAPTPTDPEGKLQKCVEDVEAAGDRVKHATLPKFLGIGPTMGLAVLMGGIGFGIGYAITNQPVPSILIGVALLLFGGFLIRYGLFLLARREVRKLAVQLGVYQAEATRAVASLKEFAKSTLERQLGDLKRRHANDRKRTDDHYKPILNQIAQTLQTDLQNADADYTQRIDAMVADRDTETRAVDSQYDANLKAIEAKFDAMLREAEDRYSGKISAAAATRGATWKSLSNSWQSGLVTLNGELQALIASGEPVFTAWSNILSENHPTPTTVPRGIRYGNLHVDLFAIPDGEPLDAKLAPQVPIKLDVPAYLPFPARCAITLKAADEGRPAAITAIQAIMLRFLTGLPPGKVRFTIIDPVGLGENFAAFMHLADFDEQLVGARIWTEQTQIERRLTDLTEHMENVIQKYLRNQYKSIEDYNRAAGEVAEPYRVLVIANFPTNFTPEAARRLVSIASSGPACGVCTVVAVDEKAPMPRDFRLADLEQVAFNLLWKNKQFVPSEAAIAAFPLTVDRPPDPTAVAALVKRVGEASRDAARVEVPFEYIMPKPEAIWTSSAAKSFDVPIGRAGATKRQLFSLGRGTAQHALVAGKTGSGKSTLLHALITNLALMYSPDEAELYLIDFKKGVEFRAYAAAALPHARVIAIESEREFGLSVLQRLDAELRDRGDKFRAAGVNDLDGYRDYLKTRDGKATLPRIMMIVDEFQEFFIEDDKLAQESSLLLDRLVRQGRAFGLHIVLGSQTLGGAYSLARSTIDQMAVRIALQCSDADAQLILSKDNNAARLLSRPGEAIYNDANGLTEGNDPFQVVWLNEDFRDQLLTQIRERAPSDAPKPLVFEGNIPAELPKNILLANRVANPTSETKSPTVWLGDAVAIKDPTAAIFRQQSGSNLLLLGQSEEAALAIATAAMVAVRAQVAIPESGRLFTLFDGTPDDGDHADYLRRAATALGLSNATVERYEIQAALAELASLLEKRQQGDPDRSPRFVIVQGLQRFRELRKPEDDFGFGRKTDGPKSPGELFVSLLRDGPAFGIHTIVWCDSLTNLTRALDRQAVKEFSQRVLFQMSANDSSTLIDSPLASRLGKARALFVQEELERPEKFRPYGLPELAWLKTLATPR